MKRTIRIILVTIILISGLTAINKTKDHKLETKNIKVQAESSTTHVEPPKIKEPPKEVVGTQNPANVQSSQPIKGIGDCMLAYNYDWPQDIAYKVCMRESGGRTDATNWTDNHGSCTGSFGIWQIGCFWFPYYGYGEAAHYDPVIGTEIAYNIWKRQGNFKAWSACKLVIGCY